MKKEEIKAKLKLSEDELLEGLRDSQKKYLEKTANPRSPFSSEFSKLIKNLPKKGKIITSEDGEMVNVFADWKERDNKPFCVYYCRAKIDKDATGWYLHNEDFGLVCLLAMFSYERLIEKGSDKFVQEIKVMRKTKSGKSLLCEIIK